MNNSKNYELVATMRGTSLSLSPWVYYEIVKELDTEIRRLQSSIRNKRQRAFLTSQAAEHQAEIFYSAGLIHEAADAYRDAACYAMSGVGKKEWNLNSGKRLRERAKSLINKAKALE